MRRVEPQVFFLAETTTAGPGIAEYLAFLDAEDFKTDAPSHAERLTEIMSRSCYRSFKPGLNPNVTRVREGSAKHLGHIIRVGHGSVMEHASVSFMFANVSRVFCYDAETEVPTDRGWKPWPEVTGEEKFATMDRGQLVYRRALEHFAKDYEGEMYRVRSEQVDLLVTPHHRMWVKLVDTQAAKRGDEHFEIRTVNRITNKRVRYQKGGVRWNGETPEVIEIPATRRDWTRADNRADASRGYDGATFDAETFARFLGYFISEGSLGTHDTN